MACRVSSIHTLLARGATTCSFTEVLWNDEAISHWLFAAPSTRLPCSKDASMLLWLSVRLFAQARKEYLPFYTYVYQKGTDSVVLYWDGNLSGDTVCFNGSGSTDLTSYCAPWDQGGCLTTWNDQASSFHAYNITGALYTDIGDNGRRESFSAGESNNLYGNSFSLGNDTASSLATQSCTYTDNLGEVATYFIGRCCYARIRGQFPGEYLNSTLGQILSDKNKGVKRAADAYKLLNDGRFRKP